MTVNGLVIVRHANWRGFWDSGADTTGNAFTTNIDWIGREQDPFMHGLLPRTVNGWSGSLLKAQQDQPGLLYRRNRYYDPGTGQFTQTDPIGLSGGINLYGYASGDPINGPDPFGLNTCVIGECPWDFQDESECLDGDLRVLLHGGFYCGPNAPSEPNRSGASPGGGSGGGGACVGSVCEPAVETVDLPWEILAIPKNVGRKVWHSKTLRGVVRWLGNGPY